MANVLRPPTNLTKAERSKRRSIYLAGPFVPGAWRDEVIAGLTDLDIDLWDPRSDVWESPEAASLSAGEVVEVANIIARRRDYPTAEACARDAIAAAWRMERCRAAPPTGEAGGTSEREQALVAEVERLQQEVEGQRAFQRSVNEALNSGDGSYRP